MAPSLASLLLLPSLACCSLASLPSLLPGLLLLLPSLALRLEEGTSCSLPLGLQDGSIRSSERLLLVYWNGGFNYTNILVYQYILVYWRTFLINQQHPVLVDGRLQEKGMATLDPQVLGFCQTKVKLILELSKM